MRSSNRTTFTASAVLGLNLLVGAAACRAQQVEFDKANATTLFATVTQVSPHPRFVVVDFGLDKIEPQRVATANLRVYLNYFTAKKTHNALKQSIARHIEVFGDPGDSSGAVDVSAEVAGNPAYANFVRLTGTVEELILEMGVNPTPFERPKSVSVSHVVIIDFHTGKSLLKQLHSLIATHESQHGEIEIDPEKRIRNQ